MVKTFTKCGRGSGAEPKSCSHIAPMELKFLHHEKTHLDVALGFSNSASPGDLKQTKSTVADIEYAADYVYVEQVDLPVLHFYERRVLVEPMIDRKLGTGFNPVVSTEVLESFFSLHQLTSFAQALPDSGGQFEQADK